MRRLRSWDRCTKVESGKHRLTTSVMICQVMSPLPDHSSTTRLPSKTPPSQQDSLYALYPLVQDSLHVLYSLAIQFLHQIIPSHVVVEGSRVNKPVQISNKSTWIIERQVVFFISLYKSEAHKHPIMVVHLITAGLTGYLLYLSSPGSDLFSWHPTCMTIAFALLITQAIVIFSPESSLTQNSTRGDKIQLHWILNVFGLFAVAAGFGSIYLNKEIAGKKHFLTWHGKFGLATTMGVVLAAVGGVAAKYSSSLRQYVKPINIKLYHGTGSMLVFICAMVTMCLACYSNWFKKRVDGFLWRCIFWCPVVLAVCVARQVTQSYLPRVATPVSQTNVKEKSVLKSGKEKKNAKENTTKTNKEKLN